jgi:NhaP-type Na+/H+ or K+/H+ antiporter
VKQRLLWLGIFSAGIVITMVLALGFAAVALYLYLAPLTGAIEAAAIIMAAAFLLAFGFVGAVLALVHRTKQRIKSVLRASALTTLAPVALRTAARRFGGLGVLAAMAAGFMATRRAKF